MSKRRFGYPYARYGAARAGCTVFFYPRARNGPAAPERQTGRRTKPSPVKDRRAQASAVKNRRVKASSVKRAYKSGLSEKTICRSAAVKRRHTEPAAAEKPWFRSICREKSSHKRGRCENCPPFHSGVLLHIGPFFGSINNSDESRSRFSNRPDRVRQLIFKAYAVCCKTLFKSLPKRLDFFVIPIGFYPKRIDKRARLAYNNSPKARQASYFWIEKGKHEQKTKKNIARRMAGADSAHPRGGVPDGQRRTEREHTGIDAGRGSARRQSDRFVRSAGSIPA